jgi:hypothetical protein
MLFHYRTDAGAHTVEASNLEHAVRQIVSMGDWHVLDTARERTDIERGAWLAVFDEAGVPILKRGEMP